MAQPAASASPFGSSSPSLSFGPSGTPLLLRSVRPRRLPVRAPVRRCSERPLGAPPFEGRLRVPSSPLFGAAPTSSSTSTTTAAPSLCLGRRLPPPPPLERPHSGGTASAASSGAPVFGTSLSTVPPVRYNCDLRESKFLRPGRSHSRRRLHHSCVSAASASASATTPSFSNIFPSSSAFRAVSPALDCVFREAYVLFFCPICGAVVLYCHHYHQRRLHLQLVVQRFGVLFDDIAFICCGLLFGPKLFVVYQNFNTSFISGTFCHHHVPAFSIPATTSASTTGSSASTTAAPTSSLIVASSSGTTSSTSAPAAVPKLPSEIVGKTVEEIIKEWNAELQERTGKFRKQANAIAEWDKRILQNRDVLLRLEIEVAKVVETQANLERQLELIETHQQEVDKALQSIEGEAERIYKDEHGLLLDDEAASTRDAMYEQAELIERELEQMTEQIKTVIQTLNSSQGGELDTIDGMTPLDVVVRILNNQLSSLMWVDEKAEEFSSRIQKLARQGSAAERELMGPKLWMS
ncbi:uncharacterized protein LOC120292665 [Eucalyptus grandis]|uniref:uncharacterized protein LOC120292665 n=1 Tax=Eucalyptus grandis TaxID=71139 RepID=UPI00192EEC42|nr:uncharacterized protein LOC120292665 [Eucalyptus grandis]